MILQRGVSAISLDTELLISPPVGDPNPPRSSKPSCQGIPQEPCSYWPCPGAGGGGRGLVNQDSAETQET